MSKFERLKYLLRSRPYALEKPYVLQFPVIDICNSQCQMCFIWKKKAQPVLTPETLRSRLSDPLFDHVRMVGINGGEPTLRKDLGDLAESLFEALPRLKHISLITNAFRVAEVKERIAEVGNIVARHGGALDVMVSLDGVGDVHDRVRGKPGNFDRAIEVLRFLQNEDTVTSIRIGCTVIKENIYGLHDLLDFCRRENLYVKYRLGIPHRRLYTQDETAPFALDQEERVHLATFLEGLITHYEPSKKQRYLYRSLIEQILFHAPRKAGCDWQHRGATLTSRGEVLYCAVQSDAIATLEDRDLSNLYFGNSARAHLDGILKTKCQDCTHDYEGLPNKKEQILELGTTILDNAGLMDRAKDIYYRSGGKEFFSRLHFVRTMRQLAIRPPTQQVSGTAPFILICGWYGTETLGDKAILGTIVSGLKAVYPTTPITVASLFPHITEVTRAKAPELGDVSILHIDEAIARAAECKMVVFGGGPLMAIDEILHMRALFRSAVEAGRPCVIAGCGVGPIGAARYANVIRDILKSCKTAYLPRRAIARARHISRCCCI